MSFIEGGRHLGVVRGWIQRKAKNGETVIWGTNEHLEGLSVTVIEMEVLSQQIKNAIDIEYAEKLKGIKRWLSRLDKLVEDNGNESEQWDYFMVCKELEREINNIEKM